MFFVGEIAPAIVAASGYAYSYARNEAQFPETAAASQRCDIAVGFTHWPILSFLIQEKRREAVFQFVSR